MNRHLAALNKIAERTGSDDPCRSLVQIARDALSGEEAGIEPSLLSLLLSVKAQLEDDAVARDQAYGWCRSLTRLIDQDAMPEAWDHLVTYLKEHGHAC